MNCTSYSSASDYTLPALFQSLQAVYRTTSYRDVVHVEVVKGERLADVFYFTFGVTVCWGLSRDEGLEFVQKADRFASKILDKVLIFELSFVYGEKASLKDDELTLPNEEVLTKLAISWGLAQSAKLDVFESTLHKLNEETQSIPEHLAKYGKIRLSRKEIRKKMGGLFIEKNLINLHVNVLDTPEFFWDNQDLEPLYAMVAYELDLEDRVEVLNQRLTHVGDLFEMLGNELNHQHSSLLEWAIIWLIVIEVVLAISKDVLHIL